MSTLILCLKVFFARICDVSLGTTRTMLIVKGKTAFAAIIAFIEVFIWFLIARQALNTAINTLWIPIAYSAGYATGTIIGSYISKIFIGGFVGVEVISMKINHEDIEKIRAEGFAVTKIKLEDNNKMMLLIQINKNKLNKLTSLLEEIDNNAFIVVNETKYVNNGFVK